MFSRDDRVSKRAAIVLLLLSTSLLAWYARLQLLFTLYPAYELARLFLFPQLPDLGDKGP